ncbi:helix-turn-helix domain-containing protein [Limimaricola litoreus]|uniref:Helix-turn-helix domain-containing protein n=2 Tax=Limimaricola litoreus TaxID=2955316 RepID=A0A9X2FM57_9RHOB|nr:helix-turn-helix domain-containing protein [Limimaricola litoreus]
MEQTHEYMLTTDEVAAHFDLSPRTVRHHLQLGNLRGAKRNRDWRCRWPDLWAVEKGPTPKGDRAAFYKAPLLSKSGLAAKERISVRTVERWVEQGLPTRNVFGSVRIAEVDAEEWLKWYFGREG